jgi:UPF0716 protein FxsA
MRWLVLLLIVVPALEIWGIVQLGSRIGPLATLAVLIGSGAVGAYLAKREGLKALTEAQRQMQAGQIPGRTLLDGICIVAGGVLLITPGFFTDLLGLTLLLPWTRTFYRGLMLGWLEKRMRSGNYTIRRR